MKTLNNTAEELFNKIRGRFPSVTIGDEKGTLVNVPKDARYFDFTFTNEGADLGKVSISLDEEDGIVVVVGRDIVEYQAEDVQDRWFNFLKELRIFAKKRMMSFDVRDINKSNLNKRDYKFLAANRPGEETMAESKMYGTNKTSYQKIGNARLAIKHTQPINVESVSGRTQKIGNIYIESPEGERFKYPFKHLSGARAMARHVSEGGNAYDDFGKYITGLSEEMAKLRKFNQYMGRSAVMAETLADYTDVVKERVNTIKKEIHHLQRENYYREAFENYVAPVVEDVPEDIAENWIDQLTIKQFNEELKDVFPYIYNLVSEATKAKEIGPEDLVDESFSSEMNKAAKKAHATAAEKRKKMGPVTSDTLADINAKLGNTEPSKKKTKEEFELEQAFEDAMGQFADSVCEECGNPSWRTLDEEKQKGLDGKVCWKGYRRIGTKMKGGKRVDNCVKVGEDDTDEGNAYAHAVRQAKMNGMKKGDKVKGPDGDEITLEKEAKTPLGEFILSYFDRHTGQFPKGETAVLTMVEKDYGDEFIEPAKAFIEQINNLVAEHFGFKEPDIQEDDTELNDISRLAGL